VGQPKIILDQVSQQKLLIWFFLIKICIISINGLKEKFHRKPLIC